MEDKMDAADVTNESLLERLRFEKEYGIHGGIYYKLQCDFTYNSNHIEGSRLSSEQTYFIFEINAISAEDGSVSVNDIVETANHFCCIDTVIDEAEQPLTEAMIKRLHAMLKNGTTDSRKSWFAVGDYKKVANVVGGRETTPPADVPQCMEALLASYNDGMPKTFEQLLEFHCNFEHIHPFQDGNGRVGRLILLKECLHYDIVPFTIDDDLKYCYYRGLQQWPSERGCLRDTCMTAQDRFKKWLDYFEIPYNEH